MAYMNYFKEQNWLLPQLINEIIPKDHIVNIFFSCESFYSFYSLIEL